MIKLKMNIFAHLRMKRSFFGSRFLVPGLKRWCQSNKPGTRNFLPKPNIIMANQFSHLDQDNNPNMVDVNDKSITLRKATAQSIVELPSEVISHFVDGEIQTKKGPVFQTAIIAGTMAAKKTHDLIPLCHPLGIEGCKFQIYLNEKQEVAVECTVKVTGKTGVEMEALTGASIAALTIYDMCKAFSHDIVIKETRLMAKSGGKRDFERS